MDELLDIRAKLQEAEEKEKDNHRKCVEAESVALDNLTSARSPQEFNDRRATSLNAFI